MKKILTTVICMAFAAIVAIPATAQQKGDMAWGLQGALATDNSNIGLGAKFRYNVIDPLRLEASFTYFFEKDYYSMWDLSVNAQWLFPVSSGVTLYPMAGLGIMGAKVDIDGLGDASDTELGLNLGAGADFAISAKTAITAELKYNTAIEDLIISAGVAFKF